MSYFSVQADSEILVAVFGNLVWKQFLFLQLRLSLVILELRILSLGWLSINLLLLCF